MTEVIEMRWPDAKSNANYRHSIRTRCGSRAEDLVLSLAMRLWFAKYDQNLLRFTRGIPPSSIIIVKIIPVFIKKVEIEQSNYCRPAHYGSSFLTNQPLLDIVSKPMISMLTTYVTGGRRCGIWVATGRSRVEQAITGGGHHDAQRCRSLSRSGRRGDTKKVGANH